MTEREYVELIRAKALACIAEIAKPPGEQMDLSAIEAWETIKSRLSAHTAVRLCDTWLAD
jgi:hypothetical protein